MTAARMCRRVLETYERPLTADERAVLNVQLESGSQPRREDVWRGSFLCLAILGVGSLALVGLVTWLVGKPLWLCALGTVLAVVIVLVCLAAGCGAWTVIASHRNDIFYATQFVQETAPQIRAALEKLEPEDRKLAEAQQWCAVQNEKPLGTMGKPFKVMLKEQPVFLCCESCKDKAEANPEKTLAKVEELKAKHTAAAK